MEIINNGHETVRRKSKPAIGFNNNGVTFIVNTEAIIQFGIIKNNAHFAADKDRLYIFFNEDKKGCIGKGSQGVLTIHYNAANILRILYNLCPKVKPGSKFLLRKSNTKINDSLTLEILIHNRL